MLIYGADIEDKTHEITIENFAQLVDNQSWKEFMPKGVTKGHWEKFKHYYDPEIFQAAGKRIRAMAHAVDLLPIEERIERITQIFHTFRNPDKETVLTPWAVVNRQLSDTLGGWCFYKEDFKTPIISPRWVDHDNVSQKVFSHDARILELNSKSGLYPLYMTYSLWMSRKNDASNNLLSEDLSLWDRIVSENIFVVCMTEMACRITRRTLVGFRNAKVNVRYIKDLTEQIKVSPSNIAKILYQGHSFWKTNNDDNMKFDTIIGNPPYNRKDGGAGESGTPLYNLFVDLARQMTPQYISMIMPAKWYTDGKGLNQFRQSMFTDRRLAELFDYTESHDCFSNVDISGGVCYFLWDKTYNGLCAFTSIHQGRRTTTMRDLNEGDEFVRHMEALSIIEKVKAQTTHFYNERASIHRPFGLRTYVKPLDKGDIILRYNQGRGPYDSSLITVGREMISQWKVIISRLTAEHAGQTDKDGRKKMLASLDMLSPNEICTETYIVVDSVDTQQEANRVTDYLKTCFVRFLVSLVTATQQMNRDKFRLVPIQNLSDDSDIRWGTSVADIDKQLYAKYELTDGEIAFIERMIKPM